MLRPLSLIKFFQNPISEKIIFGLLLGGCIFSIWLLPAFITMDGPAHLYNASILNRFGSNSFFSNYLESNTWFLPNYLTHWMLQFLLLKFNFLTAEKILVTTIVVLIAISFRNLIHCLSEHSPIYSFLIFPLVFTNLLHCGFYNFSLSFGLFNLHLLFTIRFVETGKRVNLLYLLLIGLLLYYCHLMGFALSVFVCGLYILVKEWKKWKDLYRNLFLFCLIHVPGLMMTLFFLFSIKLPFYDYDFAPFEKSLALLTCSPAIVFDKREELPYTILITILLVVLSTLIISFRAMEKRRLHETDIFLVISILMTYLMFHSKNGDLGGMFVDRQVCILFYFLVLWVAVNGPKGKVLLFALVIVLFEFGHVTFVHFEISKKAQTNVADVIAVRPYINDQSIVKVVKLSPTWFQAHISNYLGIGRDVLLLDNYEAALGWFPLSWNRNFLESRNNTNSIKPDYIFMYGNDSKLKEPLTATLKDPLSAGFQQVYESPDHFCRLFKRK